VELRFFILICNILKICISICVGFIYTSCIFTYTVTDAGEASKCYQVNNENYCFYTNGSALRWDEAREFCVRLNSTLPIVTDEDVDNVFQQFIVSDSYSLVQNLYVWIAAHARPVNNSVKWHWIDRKQSGTYNTIVNLILYFTKYTFRLTKVKDAICQSGARRSEHLSPQPDKANMLLEGNT